MNNLVQIYACIKKEQKAISQFLELEKQNFSFNNFKRYNSLLIISLLITLFFLIYFQFFFFCIFIFLFLTFYLCNFLICQNLCYAFDFSKIYYEESSWFDIKIWQKPLFLIKNDKLFLNSKILAK